ncbi:MAG: LPS export ABC transporter periplasmic protein LptC [Pseudomonadota bacterium]|nr:LPS export ABC transporter periplasmic protein LptC [Pseudomonadota bacterium]
MNRTHLMRLGRDQLSTWLPALMMMLFALGTWWLVRSAPRVTGAPVESVVSAEPDAFMRQFSVRSFDPEGRLRNELTGTEGQHFPATDTMLVQSPRMRAFDELGRLTTATAQRGQSNGDGSEIELFGDALVVREPFTAPDGRTQPRLTMQGEHLHAFVEQERVQSEQAVRLTRGQDVFTGERFDFDNQTGVANLQGRVRGVIQPVTR